MRGRLHLLSRKCPVWIWKVVWPCKACKKRRTASSCPGSVGGSEMRMDRWNQL